MYMHWLSMESNNFINKNSGNIYCILLFKKTIRTLTLWSFWCTIERISNIIIINVNHTSPCLHNNNQWNSFMLWILTLQIFIVYCFQENSPYKLAFLSYYRTKIVKSMMSNGSIGFLCLLKNFTNRLFSLFLSSYIIWIKIYLKL